MSSVKNVYIFGSMKDGFKAYPSTSQFDHLYNNTSTGWQISIDRMDSIVRYTYVLYDILTGIEEGRSGSCFGIAVDLEGYQFSSPRQLFPDLFDLITKNVVKEGKILTKNPANQKIVYAAYNFTTIQDEVDVLIRRIQFHIDSNFSNSLVKLTNNIPNKGKESMGLHPDSSELAIFDMFTQYGSVILSPRFNLMKQSYKEIIEHKDSQIIKLKEHIDELLKVKYDYETYRNEIDAQKRLNSSRSKSSKQKEEISDKNIQAILSSHASLEKKMEQYIKQLEIKDSEISRLNSLIIQEKEQIYAPKYNASQSNTNNPKQSEGLSFKIVLQILMGTAFVAIFSIFILLLRDFLKTPESTPQNNERSQPKVPITPPLNTGRENNVVQPTYTNDNYISFSQDGKKGFLKIDAFLLEMTDRNEKVKNYAEFMKFLVEYLWQSQNIKNVFPSEASLKDFIENNNPNSIEAIKEFIRFNLKNFSGGVVYFNTTSNWENTIGGSNDRNKASLVVIQR